MSALFAILNCLLLLIVFCHGFQENPNPTSSKRQKSHCGVTTAPRKTGPPKLAFQNEILPSPSYIETAVFVDAEVLKLSSYPNDLIKSIFHNAQTLMRPLNVHLTITEILSIPEDELKFVDSRDTAYTYINAFESYLLRDDHKFKNFDTTLLLTGHPLRDLKGNVYGKSTQNGACNDDTGGIISLVELDDQNKAVLRPLANIGLTTAHELAHLINVKVDNEECCPEKNCIMCHGDDCVLKDIDWSECSKEDVENSKSECTHKLPATDGVAICGNGIVEAGEECDCAPGDQQCKRCCDSREKNSTCKKITPCTPLPPPPEPCTKPCETGICCVDKCIVKRGIECGDSLGEDSDPCDLGGFCNGDSANGCWKSKRLQNTPCSMGRRSGKCNDKGKCIV